MKYISTRGVGCNHIDVRFAESVGVSVGTVAYSPDSVADYTLMLMLMAVRHTYHLLDRERIAQIKHGAFVINTGRGPLIDTEALIPALESGR